MELTVEVVGEDTHRLEVPDDPAFGVSESVGGVLLAAREAGSDARAALNLAFTEPVLEALAAEDHDPVEMDLGRRDLETSVEAAIDESPEATVLYHRGAIGVEPIVYVLGPSAVEVARTARAVTESIWR